LARRARTARRKECRFHHFMTADGVRRASARMRRRLRRGRLLASIDRLPPPQLAPARRASR
jgi:hypothetical protein